MTDPSPRDWARLVVEATDDLVYVCSEDLRIAYMNPALVRRTGRDATGERCHEALHGLPEPCPWCPNDLVIGQGRAHTWEVQSPQDGRWYHVVNVPVERGGRRYKVAIIRDITARREAEESLAGRKRFLRDVLDSAGVAVFAIDREHRCTLWNRACERLTGVRAEEVVGTNRHWSAFYDEPRPTLADLVLDGRTDRGPELYPVFGPSPLAPDAVRAERAFRSLGGKVRHIAFEAAPVRDEAGRIVAVVETLHDVTELKRAEADRERLALAVDQAAEAIVITDHEARILSANPAYEAILGVPVDRARGLPLGEVLENTDPGFDAKEARRHLLATGRWSGRVGKRRPDGREIVLDVTATVVRDDRGTPRYGLCIFRDVTEEVRWERERLRAERLRALGTLAGGIAHDFNNLLMGILGSAELLETEVRPDGPGPKHLERILRAGERARDLVTQILQFSRADPDGDGRADLRAETETVAEMLRATTPSVVEVEWTAPAHPCFVPVDPAQAQQVVLNLATNAVKALGPGPGRVSLAVERVDASPPLPPDLSPGVYYRLSVADTGCGMDPATADRIFEPFFTTRPVGEGTGLGLSVVYGVVRAAGGTIRVETAPGRGSLFEVFLPAVDGAADRAPDPGPAPEATPLRVLVVDDEEAVREITRDLLTGLGHEVVLAVSAEEALEILAREPGVEVVLTDRSMPGIPGEELARRIREAFPWVEVVLFTGHMEPEVAERARAAGASEILTKPIRRTQLAGALRRLAARKAAQRED
ncbi:PAS domain-containing hybrid sensor histidine kinase/response regulator [Deferrisoma sp.]